ncbi:hypothetical protein [Limosilactobacillus caccae]|uniref:hypothetical protein n=1 Tax=Limosilactobacillus caccae TaxID=1926284 RepID=UPI0009712809|nr:hypothetical protein [Limosilactobacillus caccae]
MKKYIKFILAIMLGFLLFNLGIVVKADSNVGLYKENLEKYFDSVGNDGDEEYYHVKLDNRNGMLKVNIKLPDRQEIYASGFYYYHAILAVKKTKLNPNVSQVSIKDNDDKYVFNVADIKDLSFSKKDILENARINNPSAYDDAKDQDSTEPCEAEYLEDQLFPKAVSHVSYDNDEND